MATVKKPKSSKCFGAAIGTTREPFSTSFSGGIGVNAQRKAVIHESASSFDIVYAEPYLFY